MSPLPAVAHNAGPPREQLRWRSLRGWRRPTTPSTLSSTRSSDAPSLSPACSTSQRACLATPSTACSGPATTYEGANLVPTVAPPVRSFAGLPCLPLSPTRCWRVLPTRRTRQGHKCLGELNPCNHTNAHRMRTDFTLYTCIHEMFCFIPTVLEILYTALCGTLSELALLVR